MFARKNSKVALTFLCLVVALGLATVSEANSLVHTPRDHAQLNRMIKKRSPAEPFLPIFQQPAVGAEGDPTASASTDTAALTSTCTTSASSASVSSTDSVSQSLTGTVSSPLNAWG